MAFEVLETFDVEKEHFPNTLLVSVPFASSVYSDGVSLCTWTEFSDDLAARIANVLTPFVHQMDWKCLVDTAEPDDDSIQGTVLRKRPKCLLFLLFDQGIPGNDITVLPLQPTIHLFSASPVERNSISLRRSGLF